MTDHYSHSQINMLLRCGEQYRRRYIRREIIPPSGNLVRGKCAHRTVETNFRQKIKTQIDRPPEEMIELFASEWNREKYSIAFSEEELGGKSVKKALGVFLDAGVRMVEKYHTKVSPTIMPAEVEEKFAVEFSEAIPDLIGVIDAVDVEDTVFEFKFVGKSPSGDDALTDPQLTTYDYGFRLKHSHRPSSLRKISTVLTKKGVKIVAQTAPPRDLATINRLLRRVKIAHEAISAGNFLPAPYGAWWCSPRFCGYYQTCKVRP